MADTASAGGPASERRLRVIAIAALVHRDHVLLAEGHDPVKGETFYRPLGGGVEFGERAAEAVVREFVEETGFEIEIVDSLGVVENLFIYHGQPGHEVVFEFVARFAEGAAPPELATVEATEGAATFVAKWLPLAEVLAGVHRVYPDALPERLAAWVNRL
jgi:ADP-ribose pyrophosphatase YjhB (NUDIX family)